MCLTSGGTEFRTEGAAQEKERCPNVLVSTGLNIKVMTSVCVRGERRLGGGGGVKMNGGNTHKSKGRRRRRRRKRRRRNLSTNLPTYPILVTSSKQPDRTILNLSKITERK